MARYKDKMMQGVYELGLKCTYPIPIDFKTGLLGGGTRVAWTNGYLGLNHRYDKKSVCYAAWCAGKEVKKKENV